MPNPNGVVGLQKSKKLQQPRRSAKQKKILRILYYCGITLLLLIPTYFAIGSYLMVKNAPVVSTDTYYTAMEITGPNGAFFEVYPTGHESSDEEEGRIFECFNSMLKNNTFATGVPDSHVGAYRLNVRTNLGSEQYTFHFSTEANKAFFTKSDGSAWMTEDETVEYFLNSPYAFELYEPSTPPSLTTAATDVVIPTKLVWSYQTKDGTFAELSQLATTSEILTYPIANDIVFYFTRQPTSCHLTIRENGTVLLEQNSVDNISLAQLTQGTVLDVEIRAFYNQSSTSQYYGQAEYRFRMRVEEAASFFINGISADNGGVHSTIFGRYQLLSCQNVRNPQNLQIEATPALKSAPVIFRRGDKVYAAIPADTVGTRTLQVTYGTISSTFTLQIDEMQGTNDLHFESNQLRGDWALALGGDRLATLIAANGAAADTASPFLFTPAGTLGSVAEDATPIVTFGDRLTLDSGDELDGISLPFEYYKTSGAVKAMAAGVVVRIGEDDVLGKYVIVDHGGGLYTWYCGLGDDIRVTQGQAVGKGDTLGLSGQSGLGFDDEDGVLVLATWGKQAIDPQYLRDASIQIQ